MIVLDVPCPDALGGQFFLWEMATAVAGHILKINPFDQPNVAASKKRTEAALRAFRETGRFPDVPAAGGGDLAEFMRQAGEADYAVVQAFLPPTKPIDLALRALASKLQKKIGRPVTYDFGPRFLQLTGQLHKGDAGRGLFLQLTARRVGRGHPDGTDPPSPPVPSGRSSTPSPAATAKPFWTRTGGSIPSSSTSSLPTSRSSPRAPRHPSEQAEKKGRPPSGERP